MYNPKQKQAAVAENTSSRRSSSAGEVQERSTGSRRLATPSGAAGGLEQSKEEAIISGSKRLGPWWMRI